MQVSFFIDRGAYTEQGRADWQVTESWPAADTVPRKGELVKVTIVAEDGQFRGVEPGNQVERQMRVIEICHTGPRNAQVYLVPTNVRVAPF